MICPKCKNNDQWRNFCSNCGNQLKEKCPECGKMEWIGKKNCLTAIKKAKKTKEEFFKHNGLNNKEWVFFLIPLMGSVIWLIGVVIFTSSKWFPMPWKLFFEAHDGLGFLVLLAVIYVPMFIYYFTAKALWERKEKKLETEFPIQHPKEAELLKKAEGK